MRSSLNPPSSGALSGRWLFGLALLALFDRILLLLEFGFRYVGSDDLIFWQGATDYAQGVFHEPCFYGQNYNLMLEALVAVPLLWCGVPHHAALPVATSVLALSPFFIFALILFRNGRAMSATFALLLPIALPVEHGMLTTVTRGFVPGLLFSGFLIIPLLRPREPWSFVVLTLSCALGYLFNPNTAVISVPMVVYVLLHSVRDVRLYVSLVCGGAIALLVQHVIRAFYTTHPAYNVHSMWELHYSVKDLLDGFSHLDRYFDHLMPFAWPIGWLVLVATIAAGVAAWRVDHKAAIALFVGSAFALACMGVNKVNDDAGVLLHSSVRMYLALPLFLGTAICWCGAAMETRLKTSWAIPVAVLFVLVKADVTAAVVQAEIKPGEHVPVLVKNRKALEWECGQMGDTLAKYDIDLLVLVPYWDKNVPAMEYLAYGCPLLDERFERTMMNVYERRTWVFEQEQLAVRKNILFHGRPMTLDTLGYYPDLQVLRLSNDMVLIRNDRYRSRFIMDLLGVELKRNTY